MSDPDRVPGKGNGRTLLLACGALVREVIEFVERNDWSCCTGECARRMGLEYGYRYSGYGDSGRHIGIVAEDAVPGTAQPRPRATVPAHDDNAGQ